MNGMIALRTIMFFILTSLTSAMVGLGLVVVLHPGDPDTKADMTMTSSTNLQDKKGDIMDNFLDLGRNLIPDNLFQAAFETVSFNQFLRLQSHFDSFTVKDFPNCEVGRQ